MVLHFDMERIPDEIIGEILSRTFDAREVVVASTCKKWRRAMKYHLKSLTFYVGLSHGLDSHGLEKIITETILQTKRLETLSFSMTAGGSPFVFPAACVHTLLTHTKDTLRTLSMRVMIHPSINLLEECRWNKLEVLHLAFFSLSGFEFSDEASFPCLKRLELWRIELSASRLSFLITLCPKIEHLSLLGIVLGQGETLNSCTSTLKYISFMCVRLDKFVLEADSLENLRLVCCDFQLFKLVSNGALKVLHIDRSKISCFDVGPSIESLENVNVDGSAIKWHPKLYHIISKSSSLQRLRVWPVASDNFYGFTDLEMISASFSQLTYLCLDYVEGANLSLQGSFLLQNLVELELGSASCHYFSDIVEGFIGRCPNLKKMTVYMFDFHQENPTKLSKHLAEYSSFILQLGRKYQQVEFEFKYD